MTLALDHTPAATVVPRVILLVRAIRARVAAFRQHRFVECVEPDDPFASMSSSDRWDLPVWHPSASEG